MDFAASTSFATPVRCQTNAMVYNAGGYRFTDFARLGIPLNLLSFAIAVGQPALLAVLISERPSALVKDRLKRRQST